MGRPEPGDAEVPRFEWQLRAPNSRRTGIATSGKIARELPVAPARLIGRGIAIADIRDQRLHRRFHADRPAASSARRSHSIGNRPP